MIRNVIKEVMVYIVRIIVIILAVVILYNAAIWGYSNAYNIFSGSGKGNKEAIVSVEVNIPKGSTTTEIGKILHDNNLINNVTYFRIMARLNGVDSKFQYGDYKLNTGMADEEIMKILTTEGAKRPTVTFTIPEGYTLEQIGSLLSKQGLCKKSEFIQACENGNFGYKFLEGIPDRPLKLQGYLFPDTYEVYEDADATQIVSVMLEKFNKVFKEEYYDQAKTLGYTIDEIVTIASIIEREAVVPAERKVMSGVIYNRLDIDMNLQMCSTVMYALGGVRRERLLLTQLEIDSPYNTYKYAGLPVGPIANPGEASIVAALYPDDNDYLYFALIDPKTGEHAFSVTYDAHVKAKAKSKYNDKFSK